MVDKSRLESHLLLTSLAQNAYFRLATWAPGNYISETPFRSNASRVAVLSGTYESSRPNVGPVATDTKDANPKDVVFILTRKIQTQSWVGELCDV